ncbi:MAG: DUF2600 family protein [Vulcanimicrobiaceae bacterium]
MLDEIRAVASGVLCSPTRLRLLFADGPVTPWHLAAFLRRVLPLVRTQLAQIEQHAQRIPDGRLRTQALASLHHKAFHVAGGAILATFLPASQAREYVGVIAPLETIYDYLDNLCDRHPEVAAQAYPVLHQAIIDALDPDAPLHDYQALGPPGDDGGYLAYLVTCVQDRLRQIPGHASLRPIFAEAATFYVRMQTVAHLAPGERESACRRWYEAHRERFAHLTWFEFAAASGSQWQVYAPLYLAMSGHPECANDGYNAYFPDAGAIHVLLDSFIDQREDREHDDFNFTTCYPDAATLRTRMAVLAGRAIQAFAHLPHPQEHGFLLRIMALFYLTHPKVRAQHLDAQAKSLLEAIGGGRP